MGQTGRVGYFQQVWEKLWKQEAFFSVVADYLGFSTAE